MKTTFRVRAVKLNDITNTLKLDINILSTFVLITCTIIFRILKGISIYRPPQGSRKNVLFVSGPVTKRVGGKDRATKKNNFFY